VTRSGRVLLAIDGRWLLTDAETDMRDVGCVDDSPSTIAAAVAAICSAGKDRAPRIVLALPSERCLTASWTSEEPIRPSERPALAYELESFLPFAAEDLTVDFQVADRSVLAVAVVTAELSPLVAALEAAGVQVASITPLALLWTPPARSTDPGDGTIEVAAGAMFGRWEWQRRLDGRILEWLSFDDEQLLSRRLEELATASSPVRISLFGFTPPTVSANNPNVTWVECETSPSIDESRRYTEELLAGRRAAPIELRQGNLKAADPYRNVRSSLRLLGAAAACAALVIVGGIQYRMAKYREHIAACDRRQAEVFHELFPGKSVPSGVRSRLRGELDRLSSIQGSAGGSGSISALTTLHRFLQALPEQTRMRTSEVVFEEGRLSLDLTTASHGNIAVLTDALKAQGFEVEPAGTEQVSDREVAVRIVAKLAPTAESKP